MESVKSARNRLFATYPSLFAQCGAQASAYAKCIIVEKSGQIQKHQCQKEFDLFKKCLQNAAKKNWDKIIIKMRLINTIITRCSLYTLSRRLSSKGSDRQKKLMSRSLPKKRDLPGVKHILLIASGKGGVGKSTTAVNLALGLSKIGFETGIMDADIFGPSIPIMLNIDDQRPDLSEDRSKMIPLMNYGLKSMSIGYLVDKKEAVVWRGPMVMGAIQKLLFETDWDPLDFLVIDLPPGMGDIHLSIAQTLKNVSRAIIVSTPQKVALIDAKKGISMFDKMSIPVLGLVDNMNSFICGKCGEVTHIFGASTGVLSKELSIPILGSIPLDPELMRRADDGRPILLSNPESPVTISYLRIAEKIKASLNL